MSSKLKAFLNTARQSDGYWIEKAKLGFAIALERWRKAKGLNNSELAQKVGVSPAYMTKVFRGDCNFTIETMVKLARACDGQLNIQIVSPAVDAKTWLIKSAERRTSSEIRYNIIPDESYLEESTSSGAARAQQSPWAANDWLFARSSRVHAQHSAAIA